MILFFVVCLNQINFYLFSLSLLWMKNCLIMTNENNHNGRNYIAGNDLMMKSEWRWKLSILIITIIDSTKNYPNFIFGIEKCQKDFIWEIDPIRIMMTIMDKVFVVIALWFEYIHISFSYQKRKSFKCIFNVARRNQNNFRLSKTKQSKVNLQ